MREYYVPDEPLPANDYSDDEEEEEKELASDGEMEEGSDSGRSRDEAESEADSEEEMRVEEKNRLELESADLSDDDSEHDSEEGDGGMKSYRLYEYHFRNIHSGEKFHVLLKTVPCRQDCDDEEKKREVESVEFLLDP